MAVVAGMLGTSVAQTNAPQSSAPSAEKKTWADAIKVKGDLRYRYESINDDSKRNANNDTYTRQRDRIRARLGAEAIVNDDLKVGMELSTGQADPVSGNQSLGDGFGKKEFRLSLAYMEYNCLGKNPNELRVFAGKMKNPFLLMVDDLVWDHDLTPEGLAFKSRWGGELASLLVNGGFLWAQERADKSDLMLYAGQTALRFGLNPKITLTVGASYYGFQNMEGYDVVDWESKNNSYGNSTVKGSVHGGVTNKAWATEFTPVVYFAQVDFGIAGQPLSLYAQELVNVDADKYDAGHLYGMTFGKAKDPRSWEIGYSYVELEKDATVGMFTDSDRWGGGTDGKGHRLSAKYQIFKNLQAGITYFLDEKKISDPGKETDYDRLQIDLAASF